MVKEKEKKNEEEPQHVKDERKVEEAIERMQDQRQWDMYNDCLLYTSPSPRD